MNTKVIYALTFIFAYASQLEASQVRAFWTYEVFQMPDKTDRPTNGELDLKGILQTKPKISRKDFETDCHFEGRRDDFPKTQDNFSSWKESVSVVCKRKDVIIRSDFAACHYYDLDSNKTADAMTKLQAFSYQRFKDETELTFDFPGSDEKVDINSEILTVRVRCRVDKK